MSGANCVTKAIILASWSLEASWSRGVNTRHVSYSLSRNPVHNSSGPGVAGLTLDKLVILLIMSSQRSSSVLWPEKSFQQADKLWLL